jgi:chorismate mutase/prephenate dehydratase
MIKVGYQGNHGTFSEIAALEYFKDEEIEPIGYPNFTAILQDTEKGILKDAVLPVENTTTGIIARTYDLFQKYDIHAVGEINVPIHEDLIGLPGAKIDRIRQVYSHPEALSQCTAFFEAHPQIQTVPYQDTAKSAEYIKQQNDPSKAALGSWRAAQYYQLETLAESVQDSATNMTRFLVISHMEEEVSDADKISMMLVLRHTPGSLYNTLGIISKRGINILKLESRPIQGRVFEYLFYIDITGNLQQKDIKEMLKELRPRCLELKVFGNYRAAIH